MRDRRHVEKFNYFYSEQKRREMKVLKFGGSSVGSPEGLRQVQRIVSSNDDRQVVVVSALGGITDQLLSTAAAVAAGRADYTGELQRIVDR